MAVEHDRARRAPSQPRRVHHGGQGDFAQRGKIVACRLEFQGVYRGLPARPTFYLGANRRDLAVKQPTTFKRVINSKTTRAIGMTIPRHPLLHACEVIE